MQQFKSLQRLLTFYTLTLLVMLLLYYFMVFDEANRHRKEHSVTTFHLLQHSLTEHSTPVDDEIQNVLDHPFFHGISYQVILMAPSGQTYVHRYTRPNESPFATVTFPITDAIAITDDNKSVYNISTEELKGIIDLENGYQIYVILRHEPLAINWLSCRYWLPLMVAIILFFAALLYMLNRRANWGQLIAYTDNLSSRTKEAYTPPPFLKQESTTEFMLLGHALSRVSYQLHNDYRRIKTLKHRLERLVDQSPLPMLMSVQHEKISFYNQSFEKLFISVSESKEHYELTDFVMGKDESTQLLLEKLSSLRVMRLLTVYGIENKQTYQLHVMPWFAKHGQAQGFTVILNNVHELVEQNEHLQQKNKQLQRKLDELNKLRSLVGYQLRIPLETMIDTLEPIDPMTLTPEQHDVLKLLNTASQNMLTMLNDTLDIGEIAVRKTRLSIEPVDIYKLGQEVSQFIAKSTRQKGLELIYFFTPECPRLIDTDMVRLRQILLNLLRNAVRFTHFGHIALIVEVVDQEHMSQAIKDTLTTLNKSLTMPESNGWLRFSVQDTGVGIEIAKQHQLLDYLNKPSSQYTNIMEQNVIGTGLKNINSFARLLGGVAELKSTPDKGSTFNLYLPCRRPTYQPIYHTNEHLKHIHLIAVIHQPLVAEHLSRLCEHLSIPKTIYTDVDSADIKQLLAALEQDQQPLAPLLLIDYEYYDTSTILLDDEPSDSDSDSDSLSHDDKTHHADLVQIETVDHLDKKQALSDLLANTSLPKILFSTKPERHIASVLLDQCDGFLEKPLNSALLLLELMRLTLPSRQALTQMSSDKNDTQLIGTEKENEPTVSPLVLVVEDSLTNQKIACKMLSKLGYRSVVAEDGQQALDVLKRERQEISLILMDCRMPVMDGLQATQAIRAQGDDIPIVALTANNTEEDREACMQVGMNEFLPKPINKKYLETVLHRFIP